jgi:hypothetical protein
VPDVVDHSTPSSSCACRARVVLWRSNLLLIDVSCTMMMLRVSTRSSGQAGSVASDGRLSGVDLVADAPGLEADTKLL